MNILFLLVAFLIFLLLISLMRYMALVRKKPHQDEILPVSADSGQIERFREAVSIPTVSCMDPEEVNKDAFKKWESFLDSRYPLINENLEKNKLGDFAYYYVWNGKSSDAGNVLMLAHFDVVPAKAEDWEKDPFCGDFDGEYIYGRGTLDTKNTLIGIMEAAEKLLSQGFQPEKNIYFAFGGDEEVVGTRGASRIADEFEKKGIVFDWLLDEGAIIADGMISFIKSPAILIGIAEKGYASVQLKAEGGGGHASMPPSRTAIGRIARAVYKLENHPQPFRLEPVMKKFLQALVPHVSFPLGFLFANLWLFGGLILIVLKGSPKTAAMVHTTLAPTILKGGIKDNVLAREAVSVLNIRVLPGEDYGDIEKRLRKTINDDKVKIELITEKAMSLPVSESATDGEGFDMIAEIASSLVNESAVLPYLVTATTDSKKYINCVKNIYRFAPMRLTNTELDRVHNLDERISLDNYSFGIQFYSELFRKL